MRCILEIEMPKRCRECPCFKGSAFWDDAEEQYCRVTRSNIENANRMLTDCPLKEVNDD